MTEGATPFDEAGRWKAPLFFLALMALVTAAAASRSEAATISGRVFEDVNYGGGVGRAIGCVGCAVRSGVTVELWDGAAATLIATATTDALGAFTFTDTGGTFPRNRRVRVVNSTVTSSRAGAAAALRSVQTFRTDASTGTAVAVTDRVGGENPTLVDPAAGTIANAQSVTPVALAADASAVTNVDFGFNFDTIVNRNDTGQGSVRQFLTNANTLTPNGALAQVGQTAGQEVSIFMISDGLAHAGLRVGTPNQLTAGRALITLASDLPGLTDANTSLDGSTQTTNVGNTNTGTLGTGGTVGTLLFPLPLFERPEVEIDRSGAEQLLTASGAGSVVASIAFHRIVLNASGNSTLVRDNLVGMRADGTIGTAAGTASYGITAGAAATNVTIRHNYVRVNNSGIRADGFTTGLLIELNEVDSPPVSAGYHTNTFDAILLIGSGTGATITHNLTLNQRGGGLEFGFITGSRVQTNVDVVENTVRSCGYTAPGGTTASTEGMGVAAYLVTATNFRIRRNVVTQSSGPGLVVMDASNIDVSENSFFANGPAAAGAAGLGIELDETSRDPNGYGAASGVTPNDGAKPAASATAPNRLMDYPILTGALLEGGNLHVIGYVGSAPGQATFASSRVELFLADESGNNQNGPIVTADGRTVPHGEGRTYLGTITTAADGTFRVTLAVAGVSIGSLLTATAADAATGGNTSEFGPNFPVQGVDYGDAPNSYLTTLASNGPRHGISSPAAPYNYAVLRIGAAVSAETDARGNPVVLDGFGDTFDDGRTLPMPALGTSSTPPYTVPITVVNQTGGPATLVAWIDFNRDGVFAATEASTSLSVPTGTSGIVNVVWASLPGLSAGRTYARFRLTADTNVGGTGGGLDATKPGGLAVNGETEDYALDISVGAPTPAVVHSVRSLVTREGTFLEWRTAAETAIAGFVVERLDGPSGPEIVSGGLVPALRGEPQGGVYRLLDPGATAGPARYVITGIEADGAQRAHGPFAVKAERETLRRGAWDPSGAVASGGLDATAHQKVATPFDLNEPPAVVAQAANTSGALKVEVTGSGLVLVPVSTLSSAFGLAPSAVTASLSAGAFSLTNRGRNVAWAPSRDLGGLLFFAEAIDSPYTTANVYFIRARSGSVVAAVPAGSPAPVGSPDGFLDTIHAEQDTTALTGQPRNPDGDYWGWEYVQSGDAALGRRTFHVTLPELVPGSGPSGVRVGLMPVATTGVAGEHHLRFRVNGVLSGEEQFEGLTDRTASFEVAAGVLVAGDNAVEVEGVLDPGTPYSYVFVNDVDVDVQRTFTAVSSRLLFTTRGVATVAVRGFAGPGVEIWDVTDPVAPKRVSGAIVEPDAGAYRARFVPEAPLRRYAAASTAGLLAPSRSVFRPTVKLFDKPSGKGSLLIVAGPSLEAASERLAAHRRAQKTTAVVVPVEDVFDAYGDGLPTPRALQEFLRDGYRNAGAKWALLAGSGTWDYRNLLGLGANRIPPMMVATARGLFPSDTAIGDFDGDGVPEVPVGRVTARTAAEMNAFVDKVIAYEATPVPGPSLLLADNAEGGLDFSADSDRIAEALAGGRATQKAYMDFADLATVRGAVFAGWAARPGFVNFIGHGGVDRLAAEGLLTIQDVSSLSAGATPIVSSLTCVINLWAIPGYSSLGDELVRAPGKGAVASWAPTGYSTSDLAPILGEEYVSRAWLGPEPILGDAVRSALAAFRARGGTLDMALVYSLLGDPSLPVRR